MSSLDPTATEAKTELSKLGKSYRSLWLLCIVLLLVVLALSFSVIAERTSNQASGQSRAACRLYKDVAESPVSTQTTPLGIHLVVDTRLAYVTAGCSLGPLKPADPLIVPYLPKDMRP